MFTFIKLLKITLPLATVTSATIATALLVSSSKKDSEKENKDVSLVLTSLEKEVEEFKHREIFYSDKGDAKGAVELSEEESQKIKEHMKNGVEVSENGSSSLNEIQKSEDLKQKHIPETSKDAIVEGVDGKVTLPVSELGTQQALDDEKEVAQTSSHRSGEEEESLGTAGKENDEVALPKDSMEGEEARDGSNQVLDSNPTTELERTQVDNSEIHNEEQEEGEEEITSTSLESQENSKQQDVESNALTEDNRKQGMEIDQEREEPAPSVKSDKEERRDGNSSEAKVDLSQLKALEDKLNLSKNALGAILESLSLV